MKAISFKDPHFKFFGVWQENQEGELVSYGAVALLEIGFTGNQLEVLGSIYNNASFIIDGAPCEPRKTEGGYSFEISEGEHTLKIFMYARAHFHLVGIKISDSAKLFITPNKPYIHYIGDSISFAYPGYTTTSSIMLNADFSVVAQCGISLVDNWGWYKPHPESSIRRGMESSYFGLEDGQESATLTPYRFEYSRKPDIIVIFLGTNDYLDNATDAKSGNIDIFANHYLDFSKKLRNLFPKTPIYMLQALTDKHCRKRGIQAAYDRISSELDNVTLFPSDQWGVEISADGTHPTQNGYNRLAECLYNALRDKI